MSFLVFKFENHFSSTKKYGFNLHLGCLKLAIFRIKFLKIDHCERAEQVELAHGGGGGGGAYRMETACRERCYP